jgi:hypothetical protein
MKKLLAMLLVLGLANFANATMMFDLVPTPGQSGHGFSPDDPLLPSEWVEIDVVYSAIGQQQLASSGMLYISIEGEGEWCGDDADSFLPPGVPIEDAWTVHPNFTDAAAIPGFNSMTKVDPKNLEIGGYTAPYTFVAVNSGETIFDHLNIHCTGPGEIIVTLRPATEANPVGVPVYWDGITYEDLQAEGSSITIYQVPEPMTIGLLGLGGLGLIRRRRR